MSWYEKDKPTPFDNLPLHGLFFLDGDLLAQLFRRKWTVGQKYPMIAFPSGQDCEVWETSNPQEKGGIIHIFGEMDLPFKDTRDRAFEQANDIAEQCGYLAKRVGENKLEVWGHDFDEHFVIVYDNAAGEMRDVIPMKDNELPPSLPLLPDEIRAQLPKLYSNEHLGLKAVAQVKFFTPDSNWTWYGSEFDGVDTFFGLVIGHEIELGYFSLSELEAVRGPMGLTIERDLFFEPKTLQELQNHHRSERGGY